MQQVNLEGKGIKLVQKENILAVFSDAPLKTVSSAFHNGGIKETRVILNIEVAKGYGDIKLHMDPGAFISESAKKLDVKEDFVAMVTAACVDIFALSSKRDGDIGVSVIATAADKAGNTCDHAESSGEEIHAEVVEKGTINIIVIIDANPNDACLVSSIITATEAKTAALLELDIRSRYSGDAATGTITDAIVCAETGRGEQIVFGGPASKLGQLVGSCTRQAVKEAIMKGRECHPQRSLADRLSARHLSVEKMAEELAKIKSLNKSKEDLARTISEMIAKKSLFASLVLAAVKLDEEVENGLLPPELGEINDLAKRFSERVSGCEAKNLNISEAELAQADLPPFLKRTLLGLLRNFDATSQY
jgi:adenosylcobinamide hydrolase